MFTSSSAYSFGEIMIVLENVFSTTYLIVLISSARFTSTIITIFLVRRMSSYFLSLLPLRVQSILPIDYFIDYVNPSSFLNIIGRMFLARFSSDRVINLALNFFYLEFNIIFIFLRLASANSIFIEVFFYISVTTRALLLITLCTIFRSVFWLSHQISAPYSIIEYITAIQIFRISPGASSYFLIIPCILAAAFLAFSIF